MSNDLPDTWPFPLIESFDDLFKGRRDAYGTDEGRCVRIEQPTRDGWYKLWFNHLRLPDTRPLGIYPLCRDSTVRWGCVDIDVGDKPGAIYDTWEDARAHAHLLERIAAQFGIRTFTEITRSNGAHVWVFAVEPIQARIMRHALLAIHQLGQLPHKEINPKQEQAQAGKVGNYVRVPYHGNAVYNQVVISLDDETLMTRERFLDEAFSNLATATDISAAADLYTPPPTPAAVASATPYAGLSKVKNKSAYLESMLVNGPGATADRSAYLWRLARTMQEAGVAFSDAWELLSEADRRHGKFHASGHVENLWALLEKAYT